MKETLESIRNFHNILILLCTAGFLFSLSVKPKGNPFEITKTALYSFATDTRPLTTIEVRNNLNQPVFLGQQIHERLSTCKVSEIHGLFSTRKIIIDSASVNKDSLLNAAFFKFLISQDTTSIHVSIDNQKALDTLFSLHEETFSIIPNDSEFENAWSIAKDMTLNEAINKLGPESDNYEKEPEPVANIFGFSISAKHMPFISPLIELLLLLYILSLLHHANTLRTEDDRLALVGFPWVALFKSPLAFFWGALTLYAFPLLTALQVIENSDISDSNELTSKALSFLLLTLIGRFIWVEVGKLKVFKQSPPPATNSNISQE